MFVGKLVISPLPMAGGRRWYKLEKPFGFISNDYLAEITVPAGFAIDMASVPIPLQPFLQKDDGLLEASVIHDYLYSKDSGKRFGREIADKIFLEAMTIAGVGSIKRGWAYWAVRMFSAKYFKKR